MNNLRAKTISTGSSFLLDSLRLGAALIVLVLHARDQWFPSLIHSPTQPGNAAHAAVVVFFVLSGYVIAHTTTSNNRGPMQYAQARLSRLYSVLLPALLITALVEYLVWQFDPALQLTYSRGASWPRYFIASLFLNEIWFFSAAPPINGPLWSLSFEFWYYVIFGFWFYRGKGWMSFILPVFACVLAGPKILLMMPIWLAGYAAYRLPTLKVSVGLGWLLVIAALLVAFMLVAVLSVYPYGVGVPPLSFAGGFLTDLLVGLFVAVALWLLPSGKVSEAQPRWIGAFRKVADLTFPIYVLHNPLFVLWRAMFDHQAYSTLQLWQAIATVLLVSICIGLVLEKQRPLWIRFFKWLVKEVRSLTIRIAPSVVPLINPKPNSL